MHSTFDLWLVGVIALAVGGAIGFFVPHINKAARSGNNRQSMEDELQALRDRHDSYRHDVAAHFDKTAELLSQLLGNYRDVHNHLANGAEHLCPNEQIRRLQQLPDERLIEQQVPGSVEAPRDYAPRATAGGKGVLDEDFGIEKIFRETTPEPPRY